MYLNNAINEDNIIKRLKYLCKQLENDGRIDIRQFTTLIKASNINIPKHEKLMLFKFLDKDYKGYLSSQEIISLINFISNIEYPIYSDQFLSLFKCIDINSSGTIKFSELFEFMKELNLKFDYND
mmetsp:Transcript_28648/g.24066  ORF Transcript_28648/g.24066 Transcript_28648/m.24066 type:complete len:125 (+) Transcript_28648:286-660(+)